MKKSKRFISALLSATMLLSALTTTTITAVTIDSREETVSAVQDQESAGAQAAEAESVGAEYTSGSYKYTLSGSNATITGYTGSGGSLTIPSKLDGYNINAIANSAFKGNKSITSLTIPDSVETLGTETFRECTGLKTLKLGGGITKMGNTSTTGFGTFQGCTALETVTIAPGTKVIGASAFKDCAAITSVTIPSTVENIYKQAFYNCTSLKSITIPTGTKLIDDNAFNNCKSATSLSIGSTVQTIGNGAFYKCVKLTSLTIPDSVETLGTETFRECTGLKTLKIGSGITKMGNTSTTGFGTFQGCTALETVTIASGTKVIGASAFRGCTSLTRIDIPATVTTIGTVNSDSNKFVDSDVFKDHSSSLTIFGVNNSFAHKFANANNIPFNSSGSTVYPTGISLNKSSLTLNIGESQSLTATVSPSNATDKSVTWSTGNSSVATVSTGGTVKGISAGQTTITAKTSNGKTATCTVYVNKPATGFSLNKPSTTLKVGQTEKLVAMITPSDASVKTISWSSSDKSVATVDGDGYVKAITPGTTKITASLFNSNFSASCTVTVIKNSNDPTGITLDITNISGKIGDVQLINATVSPSNADDKTVTWTSSNSEIAYVTSYGVVTLKSAGTATVTAKTVNGLTATCIVVVKSSEIKPTGITLSTNSVTLEKGKSTTILATVSPDNATDKTVTWSTNNSSVAVISGGKITAIGEGTTTITAKTVNGYSATCSVKVSPDKILPTGITLSTDSVSISVGETTRISCTVLPSNATDKSVSWSSNNTSVASVSSSGTIKAHSKGKATIIVKTSNGKTASCVVTVIEPEAESISLSTYNLNMKVGDKRIVFATVYPSNADDTVKWSSSNSRKARVDNDGYITALRTGTVTITAKTSNGLKAECYVTITKADEEKKPKPIFDNSDWYEKIMEDKTNGINKLSKSEVTLQFENGETEVYTLGEINEIFGENSVSNFTIDGTDIGNHTASVSLFGKEYSILVEIIEHVDGDTNEDGAVNMKDIVLLQQYLNYWDVSVNELASDVTGDGTINMKDIVLLQQYLNKWNVELK